MTEPQPIPDPLLELLAECVVRVDVDGDFAGTGFYVAPGEVLTCAHVVHGGKPITIGDGLRAYPGTKLLPPDDAQARRFYPQPDAVLLRVPGAPAGHPCVRLADQQPAVTDPLHLRAWIKSEHARGQVAQSGAALVMESVFDEDGCTLYKLRDGQVIKGFSGGPLLNLRTGTVCALIEATRAERFDLGGFGVPIAAVATLDPDLLTRNSAFQSGDDRWTRAIEAQRVAEDERAGKRVRPPLWSARPVPSRVSTITKTQYIKGVSLSRDGTRVAIGQSRTIDVHAVEGGQRVARIDHSYGLFSPYGPVQLSRDG